MIADILTVIWKEYRELLFARGNLRGIALSLLLPVVVFGIMLPSQIGRVWVESPLSVGLWGWLSLLFVTGVIADAFAGERERHTLETLLASPLSDRAILLGKVGAAVGYALAITLLILLVGLVTVNVADGHGRLLFYPPLITLSGIVLGTLTATLAASTGVLVSLRAATVRQAQQQLVLASIALTWGPIVVLNMLPNRWLLILLRNFRTVNAIHIFAIALIVLVVLDVGLLLVAMSRFERSRLILD